MEKASFREAKLNKVSFDRAHMAFVDLTKARGKDVSFFRARMNEVDLRDSEFISANFTEADLSRGLIDRANLTGSTQLHAALNFATNNVNGEGRPRPVGDMVNVELGVGGPGAIGAAGAPLQQNDF